MKTRITPTQLWPAELRCSIMREDLVGLATGLDCRPNSGAEPLAEPRPWDAVLEDWALAGLMALPNFGRGLN